MESDKSKAQLQDKEKFRVFQLSNLIKEIKLAAQHQNKQFIYQVQHNTQRFSSTDSNQFDELLRKLKRQVMGQLNAFFLARKTRKEQTFNQIIVNYGGAGDEIMSRMQQLREKLQRGFLALKKKQQLKSQLQEHMVNTFYMTKQNKKIFHFIKKYAQKKKNKRRNMQQMRDRYRLQILKKAFLPWRALNYKQGYQNTIRVSTEQDIRNIHSQYRSIIEHLRLKINETEELIKIKKAAKGQFAYALNRDLLKTISNLSMQVISLNQVVLRDQNVDRAGTQAFMSDVNKLLKEKFDKVTKYRKQLKLQCEQVEEEQVVAGKSKPKPKISFA